MNDYKAILLAFLVFLFGATEVVADTDKDDPVIQAFWKLMFEPSVENLHAARYTLSRSPGFSPYAKDIYAMMILSKTSGDPNKIIKIYLNTMPNLILSPSAHRLAGVAFAAIGDEKTADFERKASHVLLNSLLSSGDGSKLKPYAVMRIADEHDILDAMGKKFKEQEFIMDDENNRPLDVMTCSDGSKVYFDISLFYGRSE
jgi:hypothetical protein